VRLRMPSQIADTMDSLVTREQPASTRAGQGPVMRRQPRPRRLRDSGCAGHWSALAVPTHVCLLVPHSHCLPSDCRGISANVHQVHEARGARRQPGEGVSTAPPKLRLSWAAVASGRRPRSMNLVFSDVLRPLAAPQLRYSLAIPVTERTNFRWLSQIVNHLPCFQAVRQ